MSSLPQKETIVDKQQVKKLFAKDLKKLGQLVSENNRHQAAIQVTVALIKTLQPEIATIEAQPSVFLASVYYHSKVMPFAMDAPVLQRLQDLEVLLASTVRTTAYIHGSIEHLTRLANEHHIKLSAYIDKGLLTPKFMEQYVPTQPEAEPAVPLHYDHHATLKIIVSAPMAAVYTAGFLSPVRPGSFAELLHSLENTTAKVNGIPVFVRNEVSLVTAGLCNMCDKLQATRRSYILIVRAKDLKEVVLLKKYDMLKTIRSWLEQ